MNPSINCNNSFIPDDEMQDGSREGESSHWKASLLNVFDWKKSQRSNQQWRVRTLQRYLDRFHKLLSFQCIIFILKYYNAYFIKPTFYFSLNKYILYSYKTSDNEIGIRKIDTKFDKAVAYGKDKYCWCYIIIQIIITIVILCVTWKNMKKDILITLE